MITLKISEDELDLLLLALEYFIWNILYKKEEQDKALKTRSKLRKYKKEEQKQQ